MKVGDTVVCIDNSDNTEYKFTYSTSLLLSLYKAYIIVECEVGNSTKFKFDRIRVNNDNGSVSWWYRKRFILIKEYRKQKLNKLSDESR